MESSGIQLQRIASFAVDHTKLKKGMYTSRIDGDVVTYDIRMKLPNGGAYLSCGALHTFEHLFATYARSSAYRDGVSYVGPMGCRTGFYLLVRDLTPQQAIDLARESFAFIASFEGEIPGSREDECGNCREHDLPCARAVAQEMCGVLQNWTPEDLNYTR